jgi:hypothetical protein
MARKHKKRLKPKKVIATLNCYGPEKWERGKISLPIFMTKDRADWDGHPTG